MTSSKISAIAPILEVSSPYSVSSRSNSPTIIHKLSTIPFEFTENTRPGSFVSYQTPATHFSSMSGTNENFPKLCEESLGKLQERMSKIQERYDQPDSARPLALNIPELETEEFDFETGIPSLKWCAFCKCETATEVFYENSSKTFWSSVAIFMSGGVFGCFMLPYAMNSCKDIKMRCHRCKRKV